MPKPKDLVRAPVTRDPNGIEPWARWLAGVLGVGGLGSGGTATFLTESEAGPLALILAGLVLLIVAMSGRLPNRLKFGDNEAEWADAKAAVQEYVEVSIEEATPESRPELLSQLGELARAAPQVVTPALEAVVYEQAVLDLVLSIAKDIDPAVVTGDAGIDARHAFDLVLTTSAQHHVVVEVKRMRLSFVRLEQVYHQFEARRQALAPASLLVVTSDMADVAARQFAEKHSDARVARFRGAEDSEDLRRALRELM